MDFASAQERSPASISTVGFPSWWVLHCQDFFLQEQGNIEEMWKYGKGLCWLISVFTSSSSLRQVLPAAERLKGGALFLLSPRWGQLDTIQDVKGVQSWLTPRFLLFFFSSFYSLFWFLVKALAEIPQGMSQAQRQDEHLRNANTLSKHLPLTSLPERKKP